MHAEASLLGGGFWSANDLVTTFPALAGKGPLRVVIAPAFDTPEREVWGFVSVTNNETQHVTVISPQ